MRTLTPQKLAIHRETLHALDYRQKGAEPMATSRCHSGPICCTVKN